MGIVECEGKTPRQINIAIKALIAGGETDIRVRHPAAHHNLAVALTVPVRVIFEGVSATTAAAWAMARRLKSRARLAGGWPRG